MPVKWYGERVHERVIRACLLGVDDTTAAASIRAKRNHPGWRNRTGTAEGSIRFEKAQRIGKNLVRGRFGSWGVNYFIWLELKHGAALRSAADVEFPRLIDRIRSHFA